MTLPSTEALASIAQDACLIHEYTFQGKSVATPFTDEIHRYAPDEMWVQIAAAVRAAILDALINEAEHGDVVMVRRVDLPPTVIVEEGDTLSYWLHCMKTDHGEA